MQRAAGHGKDHPGLHRQPVQEVPVADAVLCDMLQHRALGVDRASLDSGAPGHLADDVRGGALQVGFNPASPEQPVGMVQAPDDRVQAVMVHFRFEGGDFAGQQRRGAAGAALLHQQLDRAPRC